MYFVDRDRIEGILTYINEQMELLRSKKDWNTPIEKLALERSLHVVIEGVLDVGNQMIDGFIMRDPGSYEDIVDILVDEQVIPSDDQESYKHLVQHRKTLVQDYDCLDHNQILHFVNKNIETWARFPENVRNFLERELGPVSAFKPQK